MIAGTQKQEKTQQQKPSLSDYLFLVSEHDPSAYRAIQALKRYKDPQIQAATDILLVALGQHQEIHQVNIYLIDKLAEISGLNPVEVLAGERPIL